MIKVDTLTILTVLPSSPLQRLYNYQYWRCQDVTPFDTTCHTGTPLIINRPEEEENVRKEAVIPKYDCVMPYKYLFVWISLHGDLNFKIINVQHEF